MCRFGVGQNLFIYKQSIRLPPADWERAVTDWYDEVSLFSNRKVKSQSSYFKVILIPDPLGEAIQVRHLLWPLLPAGMGRH